MAQITEYSGFLPIMQPELRGCESNVILAALRQASRQFCQDTEVWEEDAISVVVADTRQYDISETDAIIRRITKVRIVDTTVSSTQDPDSGTYFHPNKYQLVRSAGAYLIDFLAPYIPSDNFDGMSLVVTRTIVPDELVDVLPDAFLTEWSSAIRALAFSILYAAPRKPWSDANQAARYADQYTEEMVRAKFDKSHKNKVVNHLAASVPFAM